MCACLFYLYPSLRLFRLVGETFDCKQVCGVFVWDKTTTMHLIFCRRMLLLFSWRRRAWKERCSLDCFYNGTAATTTTAEAAACLTGLTRITDTSAAANMAGLLEEEEGFSFPRCYRSCNTNADAMQMWWDFCVLFSLLLLLQEKACAAQEEDEEEDEEEAVDKENNKTSNKLNLFAKNKNN